MKEYKHALTGEGFTMEEADDLFRNRKRVEMTAEQRRQYLATLKGEPLSHDEEAVTTDGRSTR